MLEWEALPKQLREELFEKALGDIKAATRQLEMALLLDAALDVKGR